MIKKSVFFVAVWVMAVAMVFAGGGSEPDSSPAAPAGEPDPAIQERFDYLDQQLQAKPAEGTVILTEANSGSSGMDLDAAIREAAAQMGQNLPNGTKVALVSVASSSAQLSEYVISRLEAALVSGKKLVVVDRANLDKVRAEQGFQASGEVDDNSAKSIGKLLGAGAIVTGTFSDLGDVYSLTLKAINIETATVAVSYPADIAKSTRIATLLASGGGTPVAAARTAAPAGQAATAPAPASAYKVGGTGPAGGTVFHPVVPASVPPATNQVYKVGDKGPAGGVIFHVNPQSNGEWKYLEAAPTNTERQVKWGSVAVKGTEAGIGAGKNNTALVVAALINAGENGAAFLCDDLEVNGYDDWFLPSKAELNLMYTRLKEKSLGGFKSETYWSSSEYESNSDYAWRQDFSDGEQVGTGYPYKHKSTVFSVRAIRQF
ncbi:MAG: DUF1566 domain-containing protein [Spirochaetaceae bacterium]|jgi:hypothetical protein|nr:DUF1566 domain-containing protein [Spirochaetaceae bacterium]